MGLRERGKVPDGPCDYVAVAMQISITARGGAQNLCNVARDGRFLCNYSDYG